ncbi:MAG: tetratricopeptide repeat protein [Parcubacteria group bacterium]|nr:tetratricopeptide repeat protein [Parcubacteria group bacterium]
MEDHFFDRVLRKMFTLTFFLVPIFFTPWTFSGFLFDKWMLFYVLTIACLGVWLWRGAMVGFLSIRRSTTDFFIVVLLVTTIFSTYKSVDVWTSVLGYPGDPSGGLLSFVALAIFYFVFTASVQSFKELEWYTLSFFFSAGLVTVYSLFQIFGVFLLPWQLTRSIGFNPIGGGLDLGVFVSLMIPFFAMVGGSRKNSIFSFCAVLFSVCALLILIVIDARFVWGSLVVGLALLLVLLLSRRVVPENRKIVFWIVSSAFVVALFFFTAQGLGLSLNRGLPTTISLNHSSSFEIVKSVFHERLWLGTGPDMFSYAFTSFRPAGLNNTGLFDFQFNKASNLWLDVLGSTGVMGFLSFAILFLLFFLFLTRGLSYGTEEFHGGVCVGIFVALSMFILDTFFSVANGGVVLAIALFVLLGSGYLFLKHASFSHQKQVSFRFAPQHSLSLSFFVVGGAAMVVFLLVFWARMTLADIYAGRALAATSYEAGITKLNRAIILAPWQSTYVTGASQLYLNFAFQEAQKEKSDSIRFQQLASLAIESAGRVTAMTPGNVSAWVWLGTVYERLGRFVQGPYQLAALSYEKASALEPGNPKFFLLIANVNRLEAETATDETARKKIFDTAEESYKKALSLKSDYADAYLGLALVKQDERAWSEAIRYGEQAFALSSYNEEAMIHLANIYYDAGIYHGNDPELFHSARIVLERIVAINPTSFNAYLLLGSLYSRIGDSSAGISYYEKALVFATPLQKSDIEARIQSLRVVTPSQARTIPPKSHQ